MLTELDAIPISSSQSRQEAGESIAGAFALIDKPTEHKDVKRKTYHRISIQRFYLSRSMQPEQIRYMV